LGLPKVRKDGSPFQHELQAYERLHGHCPENSKSFFPTYFGIVDLAPPDRPDVLLEGIVMSLLSAEASYRYLHSSEIPSHLREPMAALQAQLNTLNLPPVEEMWYSQIFLERAVKLTILHAICITHGDVKNNCFQIPHHPHDVALYDFSLAYTFTPEKPCMMNGSVRLIPLKKAAEIDLQNAEIAVMEMCGPSTCTDTKLTGVRAKKRAFRAYAETLLELSTDRVDTFLREASVEDRASGKSDVIILLDVACSRGISSFSLP
jgi:serine/threonine protein kinase